MSRLRQRSAKAIERGKIARAAGKPKYYHRISKQAVAARRAKRERK